MISSYLIISLAETGTVRLKLSREQFMGKTDNTGYSWTEKQFLLFSERRGRSRLGAIILFLCLRSLQSGNDVTIDKVIGEATGYRKMGPSKGHFSPLR